MSAGLPGLPTDALAGYHFSIEIDGVTIAQFQEVSGITSELDVIELKQNTKEGKYLIHKLPGNRKPPTITLKRGKDSSMDLWKWHHLALQGKMKEARKGGSVAFLDTDMAPVAKWTFKDAWCSKLTTSSVGAGKNEVVMEEATIVMTSFERTK